MLIFPYLWLKDLTQTEFIMALPLLALGLSAAPYLAQGISGLMQRRAANRINDKRPLYQIPTEPGQNVEMYNQLSNQSKLPGQAIMENNLNSGLASDLNAVNQTGGSAVNRLAAVSALNQNRNNALNDLGVQGAQMRVQNMDKLANARNVMADFKDQEFDYNKNQEFQYNRRRKNMLLDSGNQNLFGAIEGMTGVGGQTMGYNAMSNPFMSQKNHLAPSNTVGLNYRKSTNF